MLGGTERKRLWPEQGVQLSEERNSPAWWMQVAGSSHPDFTTVKLCEPGGGPFTSLSLRSSFCQWEFL